MQRKKKLSIDLIENVGHRNGIGNVSFRDEASLERIFTSGASRGGAPLFLDQTEARRVENVFLGDRPPPYFRVEMTAPPSLSECLDPPLLTA